MKKLIAFVTAVVLVLGLVGCSSAVTQGGILLKEGKVKSISVTSSPNGYDYSFSGEDAKTIVDYFANLNLISDFKENPYEYSGMTWVVSFAYEDGDTVTVYHSGNMFIKGENGPWYKMNYDDADQFNILLENLNQ